MKWLTDVEDVHDYYDEWYWPVGAAACAAILGGALILQRQELESTLWVALAVSPWVIDAVLVRFKQRVVPIPLFTGVVVVGVAGLVASPVYNDFAPFLLVLLAAEMASRLPLPGGIIVTGAAMLTMLGVEVLGLFDGSFIWFVGIAFGWAGGFCVQVQFKLMAEMRASQARVAERAALEERQRIAREIHDVVAHTLSVTMLHVTGARLALERGDQADAVAALHDAEQLGRASLTDIRRTVGVLGADAGGTEAPLPTAADLPELVAGFRTAGLDVAFDVRGDVAALPAATGLGVYRITQESLTNVAKHAPTARTEVRLAVGDDTVHLAIRDHEGRNVAARSENGGLGVRGMRERAVALGGTLDAGPDGDGWLVDAALPLDTRARRRC